MYLVDLSAWPVPRWWRARSFS